MLIKLFPIFFSWLWNPAASDVQPAATMKPAPVVSPAPMTPDLTWITPNLPAQPVDKSIPPGKSAAGGAIRLPSEAEKLVQGVQNFYKNTNHLTAKFRQNVVNKTFGLPSMNDGKVYLKKPGKMRWDYVHKRDKNKIARTQMSDGKMIWAVDVNGKWYYKQAVSQSTLPVAVTFLTGKGELSKEFNAKLLTGSKHAAAGEKVLELTPKKPSAQFKTLVLVIDPVTFRVKKSIVTSATGDTNEFSFYEPDTAKPVEDKLFVFNPKTAKGFREIKAEDAPQK